MQGMLYKPFVCQGFRVDETRGTHNSRVGETRGTQGRVCVTKGKERSSGECIHAIDVG